MGENDSKLPKSIAILIVIILIAAAVGYYAFGTKSDTIDNSSDDSSNGINIAGQNVPETPEVVLPYYYVNRGNGTITIKINYDTVHGMTYIDILENGYAILKGRCAVVPGSRRILSWNDGETNEYSVDVNGVCDV